MATSCPGRSFDNLPLDILWNIQESSSLSDNAKRDRFFALINCIGLRGPFFETWVADLLVISLGPAAINDHPILEKVCPLSRPSAFPWSRSISLRDYASKPPLRNQYPIQSWPYEPSTGLGEWRQWIDRLSGSCSGLWKRWGIYDLITLSLSILDLDYSFFSTAALFWNSSLNVFAFPSGPLTINLYDLSVLFGLPPHGHDFGTVSSEDSIFSDEFISSWSGKSYIAVMRQPTSLNPKEDHFKFLIVFFTKYLFCSRGKECTLRFVPLVRHLLESDNPVAWGPLSSHPSIGVFASLLRRLLVAGSVFPFLHWELTANLLQKVKRNLSRSIYYLRSLTDRTRSSAVFLLPEIRFLRFDLAALFHTLRSGMTFCPLFPVILPYQRRFQVLRPPEHLILRRLCRASNHFPLSSLRPDPLFPFFHGRASFSTVVSTVAETPEAQAEVPPPSVASTDAGPLGTASAVVTPILAPVVSSEGPPLATIGDTLILPLFSSVMDPPNSEVSTATVADVSRFPPAAGNTPVLPAAAVVTDLPDLSMEVILSLLSGLTSSSGNFPPLLLHWPRLGPVLLMGLSRWGEQPRPDWECPGTHRSIFVHASEPNTNHALEGGRRLPCQHIGEFLCFCFSFFKSSHSVFPFQRTIEHAAADHSTGSSARVPVPLYVDELNLRRLVSTLPDSLKDPAVVAENCAVCTRLLAPPSPLGQDLRILVELLNRNYEGDAHQFSDKSNSVGLLLNLQRESERRSIKAKLQAAELLALKTDYQCTLHQQAVIGLYDRSFVAPRPLVPCTLSEFFSKNPCSLWPLACQSGALGPAGLLRLPRYNTRVSLMTSPHERRQQSLLYVLYIHYLDEEVFCEVVLQHHPIPYASRLTPSDLATWLLVNQIRRNVQTPEDFAIHAFRCTC
ncbi:hypothetical protein Tsubulata_030796 [Turnera subulata]|uniref:Aminotransferase-like plant mobile domain-containing protein n=1 Tax=Turnera subulata TaxID=218843 RepID=A0A9Q0FAY2_9ROSI|nr:hypothetical protein Tsubulata_030796 [Turnera subulata]